MEKLANRVEQIVRSSKHNFQGYNVMAQTIVERGRQRGETQSIGSLKYKNLKLKKEEE
jgi:hypothetical protein